MVRSIFRRILRKPLIQILVGILVVVLVGGSAALVSQDFRDYVEISVARALPGTVVNGCEIKSGAICPNANLTGANLSGSSLWTANLTGANLTGAIFCKTQMPDGSLETTPGRSC